MHRTTLSVMPMEMPAFAPGLRPDAAVVDCAEPGVEEARDDDVAAISVLSGVAGGRRRRDEGPGRRSELHTRN